MGFDLALCKRWISLYSFIKRLARIVEGTDLTMDVVLGETPL